MRRLTRGQREIAEHIILLAATFALLVMISAIFSFVNSTITELQVRDGLVSLAEQTSIAIIQAYKTGGLLSPAEQPPVRVILNNFPRAIAEREYSLFYNPHDKSIVAVSKDERVSVRLPVEIAIEGEIYSSSRQRPAVSYFSEAKYCAAVTPCVRLEMV